MIYLKFFEEYQGSHQLDLKAFWNTYRDNYEQLFPEVYKLDPIDPWYVRNFEKRIKNEIFWEYRKDMTNILVNNDVGFTVGKKVVEYRKIRGIVDNVKILNNAFDGHVGEYQPDHIIKLKDSTKWGKVKNGTIKIFAPLSELETKILRIQTQKRFDL